ncbi:RidA family protein [Ornithinibacillus halotolerans]|uniref:Reactive intermediate/imine deaminase n=1 Tax=Ornithinibacillus halotolerans TaxID=1274357 RepID=A0A916W456_9BACI|nr:RidA family protein [Ornithinibacillus halotolerans]GGA65944.1 reactive intermediate/imine deaminase [Ornithinibacillus halotolerans]
MRKAYTTKRATSSGPYSHAIDAGDFVYLSGQTAKNSSDADMEGDIAAQTKECFLSLFDVLNEAGLSEEHVVKVNVYLTDMKNFDAMNEVYKTQFSEPFPARTCVAVKELPLGAEVEIEFVAKKA